MFLIDKNKIDFCTIETDDFSGNQIIEVVFKEDIEELPTVKAIPLDKVKQTREKIENLASWDECCVEVYDVLEILDKLIESEEK